MPLNKRLNPDSDFTNELKRGIGGGVLGPSWRFEDELALTLLLVCVLFLSLNIRLNTIESLSHDCVEDDCVWEIDEGNGMSRRVKLFSIENARRVVCASCWGLKVPISSELHGTLVTRSLANPLVKIGNRCIIEVGKRVLCQLLRKVTIAICATWRVVTAKAAARSPARVVRGHGTLGTHVHVRAAHEHRPWTFSLVINVDKAHV